MLAAHKQRSQRCSQRHHTQRAQHRRVQQVAVERQARIGEQIGEANKVQVIANVAGTVALLHLCVSNLQQRGQPLECCKQQAQQRTLGHAAQRAPKPGTAPQPHRAQRQRNRSLQRSAAVRKNHCRIQCAAAQQRPAAAAGGCNPALQGPRQRSQRQHFRQATAHMRGVQNIWRVAVRSGRKQAGAVAAPKFAAQLPRSHSGRHKRCAHHHAVGSQQAAAANEMHTRQQIEGQVWKIMEYRVAVAMHKLRCPARQPIPGAQ